MNVIEQLFSKLTLAKKFALIAAPVGCAFGLLFFNYFQNVDSSIQVSKQELIGANNLPLQTQLLSALQKHRGLSAIVLSGDSEKKMRWMQQAVR